MGASRTDVVKSDAELLEDAAQAMARYQPSCAIEGWAAGHRANGECVSEAVCERALEIQAEWKVGS